MVPETPAMSGPGASSPEDGKAGMHMSISVTRFHKHICSGSGPILLYSYIYFNNSLHTNKYTVNDILFKDPLALINTLKM